MLFKSYMFLSLCLFVVGWATPAWTVNRIFTVTAKVFIGDNQTKIDARQLAVLEAKRQALEQAGTYVESLTIVQQGVVSHDEILLFTSGVTETQLLAKKPSPMVTVLASKSRLKLR